MVKLRETKCTNNTNLFKKGGQIQFGNKDVFHITDTVVV